MKLTLIEIEAIRKAVREAGLTGKKALQYEMALINHHIEQKGGRDE